MYRITAHLYGDDDIALTIQEAPDPESSLEPAVSPEQGNVITFRPFFLYMDVGRWGGASDRYFGVVYGNDRLTYIGICEYADSGSYIDELPGVRSEHYSHTVVRTVLGFLNDCSSRVVDGRSFSRSIDTGGKLYLLLGDVHLPVYTEAHQQSYSGPHAATLRGLTATPCRVDGNYIRHIQQTPGEHSALERFSASGVASADILSGGEMDLRRVSGLQGWQQHYTNNDIFTVPSSNAPADNLQRFVSLARGWENGAEGLSGTTDNRRVPIHFIQLGDMYELWVGLRRLYEETSSPSLRLRSPPLCERCQVEQEYCPIHSSGRPTVTAQDVIQQWVNCVHQTTTWSSGNGSGVRVRTSLAEGLGSCGFTHATWLYGNHDNYLGMLHRQLSLPQRQAEFVENGILAEHGHAGDEYNRDGEAGGHAITQCGAFVWNLRPFTNYDFIRNSQRRTFLEYAIRRHLSPRYFFQLFVMAHTHHTYLASVTVHARR